MKNDISKLILVCLIAVIVILGISIYFIEGNNSNAYNTLSANQTTQNTSVHVTTQSTSTNSTKKQTKNNSVKISAQQAINVVKHTVPSYNCHFGAELVKNNGKPYYLVTAYDDATGEAVGGAEVDARTGKFMGGMG